MLAQRSPMERLIAQIYFNTNPESAEKLGGLAAKGLKELAENGPTQEHFNMAIENFKKNLPESRINNGYWMNCLEDNLQYGIDYDEEYEAALNAVTAEDIKSLLQAVLAQENFIQMTMSPAK